MSDQEIAEKMVEIVDEFQRQTGMPDEVADSVVRHCFRKMELIDAPAAVLHGSMFSSPCAKAHQRTKCARPRKRRA